MKAMTAYTKKLPAAEYHRDTEFPGPTLSASTAATLIRQSPLHAWLHHPWLGVVAKDATAEMDRGTLIHALVFGEPTPAVVLDFPDYRTKAAQAARDDCRDNGMVPVLAREWQGIKADAEAIREEVIAQGFPVEFEGAAETAFFWQEDTSTGPVQCRGMMDWHRLADAGALILDLKTCRSAHPRACQSHVIEHGYDIQAAAYTSAVEHLRPDLAGRVDFAWAFAEILPAGSPRRAVVTIARPSGEMRELGRRRWARACEQWAACLASGRWPGPCDTGLTLEPPAWALAEEMGAMA